MSTTTTCWSLVRFSALLLAVAGVSGCAQTGTGSSSEQAAAVARAAAEVKTSEPPLLPGALRAGHPQRYLVQPGDNLYQISGQFLQQPWRWQGLWAGRGQTPKIYPGNELALEEAAGQPQLRLVDGRPLIKLSPQVRVETTVQPIPTIPSDAVAPFLSNAIVLSKAQWQGAPYVVGNADGGLLPTIGSRVFARGGEFDLERYRVYRPADPLREPGSGDELGYAMTYVGEVELIADGDPAELRIVDAERGMRPGDRLLPLDDRPPVLDFTPRPVPTDTHGRIIGSLNEAVVIGRNQNVAVNLGAYDGMQPGHVLAVFQAGESVIDPVAGGRVQLPDNPAGFVVLYKVFDLVSYGLVAESERPIRVNDRVGEP